MSANDRQVGGYHYKGRAIEHWDMVAQVLDGRYLEGCVTKYISRHRNKNGKQDLEKSSHYLEKLIEQAAAQTTRPLFEVYGEPSRSERDMLMMKFCEGCKLDELETTTMLLLVGWKSVQDLRDARVFLSEILRRA